MFVYTVPVVAQINNRNLKGGMYMYVRTSLIKNWKYRFSQRFDKAFNNDCEEQFLWC